MEFFNHLPARKVECKTEYIFFVKKNTHTHTHTRKKQSKLRKKKEEQKKPKKKIMLL